MAGTTTAVDLALLLTVLGLLALVRLAAVVVGQALLLRSGARPPLPAEDRPPAGLGRLVPVGAQVDAECRRGLAALEQFLLSSRRP